LETPLGYLCWKWKPCPRVVFRNSRLIWVWLYMRSLLLTESSDFIPSNQYILVRVIPSCLFFMKTCLCQVVGCNVTYFEESPTFRRNISPLFPGYIFLPRSRALSALPNATSQSPRSSGVGQRQGMIKRIDKYDKKR
jgi:hypothetical protein